MREKKQEIREMDKFVSRKLRFRRKELGISQTKVGKYIAVSIQQIQKYESGVNRITSGKLYYIADLLKVPVEYFFEDNNKNSRGNTI
jgi:transcriptional regulator with XRE-family HTH domain